MASVGTAARHAPGWTPRALPAPPRSIPHSPPRGFSAPSVSGAHPARHPPGALRSTRQIPIKSPPSNHEVYYRLVPGPWLSPRLGPRPPDHQHKPALFVDPECGSLGLSSLPPSCRGCRSSSPGGGAALPFWPRLLYLAGMSGAGGGGGVNAWVRILPSSVALQMARPGRGLRLQGGPRRHGVVVT